MYTTDTKLSLPERVGDNRPGPLTRVQLVSSCRLGGLLNNIHHISISAQTHKALMSNSTSLHYKLREAPFAGAVVVISLISIIALLIVLVPSQTHNRTPHKSIPASWEKSFEKIESESVRQRPGGMASKENE